MSRKTTRLFSILLAATACAILVLVACIFTPAVGTAAPIPTATPPGEDITDANYVQAQAAYLDEAYREVIRLTTLVIDADPNLAPAYWYRGMAHYYLHELQAGLADMEAALVIDPHYALAYADRGLIFEALGHVDRALADWAQALAIDPTLAKVHHNLGVLGFNRGDYDAAVEEYARAVEIDPTRAVSWANLAQTYQMRGDMDECVDSAGRAVELDPDLMLSYCVRSYCLAGQNKMQAALADLNIYLAHVTDNYMAWYNRGNVHRALAQRKKALADYDRSLELAPTFTWALINRSNTYQDLHRFDLQALDMAEVHFFTGDYEEAIDEIDRALAFMTSGTDLVARAERIRGQTYYKMGHYQQAVFDLSQSIGAEPVPIAYYYRALAYRALHQDAQAREDMKRFGYLILAAPLVPPRQPDVTPTPHAEGDTRLPAKPSGRSGSLVQA